MKNVAGGIVSLLLGILLFAAIGFAWPVVVLVVVASFLAKVNARQ